MICIGEFQAITMPFRFDYGAKSIVEQLFLFADAWRFEKHLCWWVDCKLWVFSVVWGSNLGVGSE